MYQIMLYFEYTSIEGLGENARMRRLTEPSMLAKEQQKAHVLARIRPSQNLS